MRYYKVWSSLTYINSHGEEIHFFGMRHQYTASGQIGDATSGQIGDAIKVLNLVYKLDEEKIGSDSS